VYRCWLAALEKPELAAEVALRFHAHFSALHLDRQNRPCTAFYGELNDDFELKKLAHAGTEIATYISNCHIYADKQRGL
jgi:hypothetical protein